MNWMDAVLACSRQATNPEFAWRFEENQESPQAEWTRVPAEIRNEHLQNTTPERYL
jgi:hypothetical protein